jgi:hypothetical protein
MFGTSAFQKPPCRQPGKRLIVQRSRGEFDALQNDLVVEKFTYTRLSFHMPTIGNNPRGAAVDTNRE